MFSALSAAWNCSSVSILFSLLMLSTTPLNCVVAELVAELFAALDEQHLVDRVDHDLRRDLVERLAQLDVVGIALQVDLLALLAQRGDLALLEIGLGEDLAVHLHENLLDDFAAGRGDRGQDQTRRDSRLLNFINTLNTIFYL